jgi:HK97 family phage major capsid protein
VVRIGENQPVDELDPAVGQKVLRAYMYTSRIVRVPYQFLQDHLHHRLLRVGWAECSVGASAASPTAEFTTGVGGGNEPEGLMTAAPLGATTAGVGVIAYGDLVELEHSVDPAYRNGAQWMMNDQAVKEIKQLVDLQNRPVWVPGIAVREPDTILGYRYIVNQHCTAPGAGGWNAGDRAIAFGDMSYYYVRDVRGFTIIRLDERYADNLQVGFLAYSRHDGALIDAGTHPVRYLAIQ